MTKMETLTEMEKAKAIVDWVTRKPTASEWAILTCIIGKFEEGFLKFIIDTVVEDMESNGDPITTETVKTEVRGMLEFLAIDQDSLWGMVEDFVRTNDEKN